MMLLSRLWIKTKLFSSKSLYRFLSSRGMSSRVVGIIWKCKIPLKINFFHKLPIGQALIKRGWRGDGNCCVFGLEESVDHIFLKCVSAKMVWTILKEAFGLDSVPRSLKELSENWLQGKGPLPIRLIMFLFAAFAWVLWTTRNKMAIIEKIFPKMSSDVLYATLSLL